MCERNSICFQLLIILGEKTWHGFVFSFVLYNILLTYFSEDTLLFWVVNTQCVTYATCVGLKKEKKQAVFFG